MGASFSKWRVVGLLLIGICFLVFSSTSLYAATQVYTVSINSAASVVHTTGGYSGQGMGDLSISGTFQAVVTDGVIEFHNIDVATNPSTYPDPGTTIIPSYPGTATPSGNGYSFSGSKMIDSTGGGAFNGGISSTGFSLSGNFQAPCCDMYNYEFVISGAVTAIANSNTLLNGSFENGFTSWDVTGFSIKSSFTDVSGHMHLPTNGSAMAGVTSTYGYLHQNFLSTDTAYMLSFDRNVVDPWWPGNNLAGMPTYLYLRNSAGNQVWADFSQFSFHYPKAANTWENILIKVPRFTPNNPNLNIGEVYRLDIATEPNSNACIPEDPECIFYHGTGTVLIDNVVLTPISEYVCIDMYNPVCGSDGKTYANECEAAVAGVGVVHTGACGCGECISDADCGTASYCNASTLCLTSCSCPTCTVCAGHCVSCNDNNACTTDTYIPGTGCVHTPIVCNDNNICTTDTCNTASGCVYTTAVPAACNDNNACTADTCSNNTCWHTPVTCNDNNYCTADTCDPATGCVYTLISNCSPGGTITTIAGNGTAAYSGDNGPAISASLHFPNGILTDTSGNVYFTDRNNNRLRKVDTAGIITTAAGNGTLGYSGDNGPALQASMNYPRGIAMDAAGNIYIADEYNHCIRKVDTSGIITTVAGNGLAGFSGDNGPAALSLLNTPRSVAVDPAGNLYIADSFNRRIRKVDTSGIITTIAGNGTGTYSGDDGPATSAGLVCPDGVAVDLSGNIYVADYSGWRVRKVNTAGIITTFAGNGINGYSGDGGPATSAKLYYPETVTVDTAGNIYIADQGNNRVRKVDASGIITTVAGNGTYGYSGDNGPALLASLASPRASAVDTAGNIYIADFQNNRIRKVAAAPGQCTGLPDGSVCNDNNTCTTNDVCSAGNCIGTPIACNDNNACTVDTCNTATGCIHTVIMCNDNNVCTNDACSPATGCFYTPITCNDNNICTTDTCNTAVGCVFTPLACPAGQTCNPTLGCIFVDQGCNDYNTCTIDSMRDPVTGICSYSVDMNHCPPTTGNNFTMIDPTNTAFGGTNDVVFAWDGTKKTSVAASDQVSNALISSPCQFFGVRWAAHDVTVYGPGAYTVYSGCAAGSPGCGTGAPITFTVNPGEIGIHVLFDWNGNNDIDVVNVMKPNSVSSNMFTGSCGSNLANKLWSWASYDFNGDGINGTPMVDGPFVGMNANFNLMPICGDCNGCDDNNACTTDFFSPVTGTCIHTAISCDDNNKCTLDSCNSATGCRHDEIMCLTGYCDPQTGVCVDPCLFCNDNNACTIDQCDPITGCVHLPLVCNDNNACTNDTCNPATGCVFTPKSIDDNNKCTIDACDPATGIITHTPISCNDGNACTQDRCDINTGLCVYVVPDCSDNNACTTDWCDPILGCRHEPVICNDNSLCTTDSCNPLIGCVYTPIVCNDNNACTTDSCNAATGCVYTEKVCNDNNACTTDTCNTATGACVYTPVANGTACGTGGTCQSGTCQPCSCPARSYKTVTLKGTGSNSWWIENQIQTTFTVSGGGCGGCILRYTASTLTATPGTVLKTNWRVGSGPQPTSVTWKGVSVPASTVPYTITCPSKTGTVGSLVLSNTSARGGKDTDTLTVSVATN